MPRLAGRGGGVGTFAAVRVGAGVSMAAGREGGKGGVAVRVGVEGDTVEAMTGSRRELSKGLAKAVATPPSNCPGLNGAGGLPKGLAENVSATSVATTSGRGPS